MPKCLDPRTEEEEVFYCIRSMTEGTCIFNLDFNVVLIFIAG